MRHIRRFGVCLLAACTIGVVMAASASAGLPELGGCEAKAGGKYADSACTETAPKHKGTYEWYTGTQFHKGEGLAGYNFEPVIGPITFETVGKIKIECEGGFGVMKVRDAKTINEIMLNFHGCKANGEPCRGEFLFPEEISNELNWFEGLGFTGRLVYVAGGGPLPTVGLEITTVNKREILFTVVCDNLEVGTLQIGGSKKEGNAVIAVITPVDQMTTEYTQTFSGESGIQSPNARASGKKAALQEFIGNNNKWEQSAWTSTLAVPAEGGLTPTEIRVIR